MRLIPFIDGDHFNIFVVLEDDNLERMKAYDPANFDIRKFPGNFQGRKVEMVMIGYATKADLDQVDQLVRDGKPREALKHLSRGFKYRPDLGDHDRPYTPSL